MNMKKGLEEKSVGRAENLHAFYDPDNKDLILRMNIAHEIGPSSSGKSVIIATSHGHETIEIDNEKLVLVLNLYQLKK